MIWIDWCIVAFFVISILIGVIQGFVREVLNLLVWVLAFGLASVFGHMLANMMIPYINEPAIRLACAYLVLFISGLVVGSILSHLITELVRSSIFSGVDRSLGAGFGFLRGVLVVTVFVLCAGTMGAKQDHWWTQSMLVPRFAVLSDMVKPMVPESWLDKIRPDAAPAAPPAAAASRHTP
ncbi:MAG TPA: CvpA family protein [Stenotrophobium sp.]|jgi:membrane protein required for colicin V production|nr:CvpA family protein [Stenotrophobium sp.]